MARAKDISAGNEQEAREETRQASGDMASEREDVWRRLRRDSSGCSGCSARRKVRTQFCVCVCVVCVLCVWCVCGVCVCLYVCVCDGGEGAQKDGRAKSAPHPFSLPSAPPLPRPLHCCGRRFLRFDFPPFLFSSMRTYQSANAFCSSLSSRPSLSLRVRCAGLLSRGRRSRLSLDL